MNGDRHRSNRDHLCSDLSFISVHLCYPLPPRVFPTDRPRQLAAGQGAPPAGNPRAGRGAEGAASPLPGRQSLPEVQLANVYLDRVDQLVKRELRCRWYLRYVDDMILLAHDAAELLEWRERIARFLGSRLGLRLKDPHAEAVPVGRGVDFVGWKTWWSHRVPRRRTLANLDMRLRVFQRAATEPWGRRPAVVRVALAGERAEARVANLQATLASYAGHLRNGAAFGHGVRSGGATPGSTRSSIGAGGARACASRRCVCAARRHFAPSTAPF